MSELIGLLNTLSSPAKQSSLHPTPPHSRFKLCTCFLADGVSLSLQGQMSLYIVYYRFHTENLYVSTQY